MEDIFYVLKFVQLKLSGFHEMRTKCKYRYKWNHLLHGKIRAGKVSFILITLVELFDVQVLIL